MQAPSPPSPFFRFHAERVREAARLGAVVDLACGRGRHALAAAALGAFAVGLDRDAATLAELRARAAARRLSLAAVRADLEAGPEIPLRSGSCGAILVFRFLFRPIARAIREALRPGGLLLYETFTTRQRELASGPRNPAFLLGEGELRALFSELELFDYWEGIAEGDRPAAVARLAARRR